MDRSRRCRRGPYRPRRSGTDAPSGECARCRRARGHRRARRRRSAAARGRGTAAGPARSRTRSDGGRRRRRSTPSTSGHAGINDTLPLGLLNELLGLEVPIVVAMYSKAALTAHPAYRPNIRRLKQPARRFLRASTRSPSAITVSPGLRSGTRSERSRANAQIVTGQCPVDAVGADSGLYPRPQQRSS